MTSNQHEEQSVDLLETGEARQALIEIAYKLPSIQISNRSVDDLQLLATGGFAPLDRFMGQQDYKRVMAEMRMADGTLFPLPITLTVDRKILAPGVDRVALRDSHNRLLAVMEIGEVFTWNADDEARQVLGTTDPRHPLVSEMIRWGDLCISGRLRVVNLSAYFDFADLRHTPAQARALL